MSELAGNGDMLFATLIALRGLGKQPLMSHQWLLAVLRWPQARLQCASSVHVLRRPRLQLRALRKDCRQQLKGWARRLCCNILRWVASR